MNPQRSSKTKTLRALNLVDSSLATLKAKGNLGYVNELYNPSNFFEEVHHISFYSEDAKIVLENNTIKIHVLKKVVNGLFWHPANVLLFLLQIISISIRNRIRLIRARSIGLAGFLGLLTGKVLGIPVVVSIGGSNKKDRELTFYLGKKTAVKMLKMIFANLMEVFILHNADCVIVPNPWTRKNYAIPMKASERKTKIVSWILKRDVFDGRMDKAKLNGFVRQLNLDLAKPIVLYVGRLEYAKQVDVLMESIPLVVNQFPDAQFVFIGDGSLRDRLKERASELNVAEKVFFLGYQPTDIIKAFLGASSVVWIPASGFVVLEAAAFGAPIVGFDIEWQSEFILNEVTGLLVKDRDYAKMAEAVSQMLNDPMLARKWGEAARHKLMEEYNPETLKKKEIEIYESLI